MKVCWIHSFPSGVKNSGIFMWNAYRAVQECGVEVETVSILDRKRPLSTISDIKRIKREDYDILHAQYGSGCGSVASLIPGRKVLTLRGSDWYGSIGVGMRGRVRGAISRRLTMQMINRFDLVVAESNRMAREICAQTNKQTVVLPNGVDLERFTPMDRTEARSRLGEGDDHRPWILFASTGRAKPVKRPALAGEVIAHVRKDVPDVQMKTVTNVPHELMPILVNASDCVLVTSVHEGWPNIVKEALGCDVPFVSTDVSDLRDVAAQTETCRVCSDEVEDLADAVIAVLRAGRPAGLRSLIAEMDMPKYARALVSIYDQLLRHPGKDGSTSPKALGPQRIPLGSA